MADINENDDYVHRLGKLVPIYVVVWVFTIEGFLKSFTDFIFQASGTLLVIIVAFAMIYLIELRNQKITRTDQIFVSITSTIVYLMLILVRIYFPLEIQFEGLIAILVLGWTFIAPQIVK